VAHRTQIVLIDDLDGKEITDGGQSISFSVNGVTWEIDLSDKNAKRFETAFEPFMAAGRKVSGRPGRGVRSSVRTVDTKAVRAWAASNRIELAKRGRIPREVIQRYHEAGY
jgi:hypothetical protein